MIVVATYDVPDKGRRFRLHKLLTGYGIPVQRSVFECDISPRQLDALSERVKRLLEDDDDLRLYSLCERCHAAAMHHGQGPTGVQPDFLVL